MTNFITLAQAQVDPFRSNSSPGENVDPYRIPNTGSKNITLLQGEEIDFGEAILNKNISVDEQNKILKIKHPDGRTVEISYTEQFENSYLVAGRTLVINNNAPEEGVQLILSESATLNNITKLGMNSRLDITFNGKTIEELDTEAAQARAETQKAQEVSFNSQQLIQSGVNTAAKISMSVAGTSVGGIVGGFLGSFIPIPGVGTVLGVAAGSAAGAFISNIFGQTVIDKQEINWWEAGVDGTIAGATGGLSKYFTIATKAGRAVPTLVRAVVGNGSIVTRATTNGFISTSSGIVIRATDDNEETQAWSLSSMALDGLSGALIGEASHQVGRNINFRENKVPQPNQTANTTTVTSLLTETLDPSLINNNNPEIIVNNSSLNNTALLVEAPQIIIKEPSLPANTSNIQVSEPLQNGGSFSTNLPTNPLAEGNANGNLSSTTTNLTVTNISKPTITTNTDIKVSEPPPIPVVKPIHIVKAEIGQAALIPETSLKVVISEEGGVQHFRLSRENRADAMMKGSGVKADGKLEDTVSVRPGTKEDLAVKEGNYIRVRSSKNNEVTTYMVKTAKPSTGDFELEKIEI